MKLTEKQELVLKKYILIKGEKIYKEIRDKYAPYLSSSEKVNALEEFAGEIIVDSYNEDDVKLFGSIDKIPPGHAGRRKQDNRIHVYPYSPQISYINDFDELKKFIVNDVIIHEIFHFYAQPDLYDQSDVEHKEDALFGHRLTEGIVQYFTDMYIEEHKLNGSNTTYVEEVQLVKNIKNDLENQGKNDDEINSILLNKNQIEILAECTNGDLIKNEYLAKLEFHQAVNIFLKNNLAELQKNNINQLQFYRDCLTSTNIDKIYIKLKENFPNSEEIDNFYETYCYKINKNVDEKTL